MCYLETPGAAAIPAVLATRDGLYKESGFIGRILHCIEVVLRANLGTIVSCKTALCAHVPVPDDIW